MINRFPFRRAVLAALAALSLAGASAPMVVGSATPALAQGSDEFQAALEAYGHWVRRAPYGEVWVPDGVPPDWRPYQYGHWVYTDNWGWYWVSDESEDDWGWVVYHYGRWAFDRGTGWFWVPGDDWAPAWVDWRYGGDTVGWAPLPPDDLMDTYEDQPDYWMFVQLRYIGAPRLRTYYLPSQRRAFALRETRIVNRPVHVEGRRIWVNPGLAPGFIAGRTRVTLPAYQVRPRVFANTNVQGAVTVRPQELHTRGAIRRVAPVTVQRTTTVFQPSTAVPPPKPLGKNDHGVLGPRPPRAAQGAPIPPPGNAAPGAPPQAQPTPTLPSPPQPANRPASPPPGNVAPPPKPPAAAPLAPPKPTPPAGSPPQQQQQQRDRYVAPPPQPDNKPPAPPPQAKPPSPPPAAAPTPPPQAKPPSPPPAAAPMAPPKPPAPPPPPPPPPPRPAAPPPRPAAPPPPPPPPPPQQQQQQIQRAPAQPAKPPAATNRPPPAGEKKPDEQPR